MHFYNNGEEIVWVRSAPILHTTQLRAKQISWCRFTLFFQTPKHNIHKRKVHTKCKPCLKPGEKRINTNRNLVCVVPALFGVSLSPVSRSGAVRSIWPASGQQPPSGSSPHHSGTLSLSNSTI